MIKIDNINYMERDAYGWTLTYHTKNEKFGKVLPNGNIGINEWSEQKTYHADMKQVLKEYCDRQLGEVNGTLIEVRAKLDELWKLIDTIKNENKTT